MTRRLPVLAASLMSLAALLFFVAAIVSFVTQGGVNVLYLVMGAVLAICAVVFLRIAQGRRQTPSL